MATTVKNITLAITKEDLNNIEFLIKELGETQSSVIKRAITLFAQHIKADRDYFDKIKRGY